MRVCYRFWLLTAPFEMSWLLNCSSLAFIVFSFFNWPAASGKAVKIQDLSHDVNNETIYWPNGIPFQLFIQHRGWLDPSHEPSEKNFWYEANDFMTSEHSGTHLDAPVHFAKNHWSVDQIPPERFIASVSIVDLRNVIGDQSDYQISKEDLIEWESVNKQELGPLILLWTGWADRWPNRERYLGTAGNDTAKLHFPGLHPDAAQWLVDHRTVFGVGIDTASIDYGQSEIFGSHRILASKNAFNIENVNTKNLDLTAFPNPLLIVNPLKISTGSGSPVRALLVSGLSFLPHEINRTWSSAKSDL